MSKSPDILSELIHEAKLYQLDSLTIATLLKPVDIAILRENYVVIQNHITSLQNTCFESDEDCILDKIAFISDKGFLSS